MDARLRWSRWVVVAGALGTGLGCHAVHGGGPYPDPSRVAQGAIVGSMAGAAIGAGVDHRDRGRGAILGAVGGLLAGALLGHEWEHAAWHHAHHDTGPYGHPWWCDGAHAWPDEGGYGDPRDGYGYDDDCGCEYEYEDEDGYEPGYDDEGGYGRHRGGPGVALAAPPPDVLFAAGSAELTPAARAHLQRVADRMRADPDVEVLLRGHSDGSGNEGFDLSDRRARSVRAFLAEQGVAPRRIAWVGLGDSRPVAAGGSADARRRNRRVEIVLRDREAAPDPYSSS